MHRALSSGLLGFASTFLAAEATADTAHVTDDANVQLDSLRNCYGSESTITVKNWGGGSPQSAKPGNATPVAQVPATQEGVSERSPPTSASSARGANAEK